jgi:hypothetical protein
LSLQKQLEAYQDAAARAEERGQTGTYWHDQVKRLAAALAAENPLSAGAAGDEFNQEEVNDGNLEK